MLPSLKYVCHHPLWLGADHPWQAFLHSAYVLYLMIIRLIYRNRLDCKPGCTTRLRTDVSNI